MVQQMDWLDEEFAEDGVWSPENDDYIVRQGIFDSVWPQQEYSAVVHKPNAPLEAVAASFQIQSRTVLPDWYDLSVEENDEKEQIEEITDNWDWQEEEDEYGEWFQILPDDIFTQEDYARRTAYELLDDFGWPQRYLAFLTDIFLKPRSGATKTALYRAVERNIPPELIICAYELKKYWEQNACWHISMLGINSYTGQHTHATHWFLSWPQAFKVLSCFEGIPCLEEVIVRLEDLYDFWFCSNYWRQECKTFIDFVGRQTAHPAEYWLVSELERPDDRLQPIFPIGQNRSDTLLQAAYYYEEHHPTTWERHCALIAEWVAEGRSHTDIFKKLPLDLAAWPEAAKKLFFRHHLTNLYDALKPIYIELRGKDLITSRLIVQAYRNRLNVTCKKNDSKAEW